MEDADMAEGAGRFRSEAAEWFAIMRGPDADVRRAEFDAWIAASPAHRQAYNRIAETFSYGKFLKSDAHLTDMTPNDAGRSTSVRARKVRAAFAVGAVIAICSAVSLLWAAPSVEVGHRSSGEFAARPPGARAVRLSTRSGQIRPFRLPDGSKVTLDTDSVVLVTFDEHHRNLRLLQGHARFEVAHEDRPFAVAAGSGTVTARGTIFDVTVARDRRVTVELLKGAVDVDPPHRTREARPRRVRLSPGEFYAFTDGREAQSDRGPEKSGIPSQWPEGLRDYKNVPLAAVLTDANRYGALPIVTASRDLDAMRISGTFRISDPHRLARNLARLLGLSLVTLPNSVTLARSCAGHAPEICHPPS
jgi:transmembrane sensor